MASVDGFKKDVSDMLVNRIREVSAAVDRTIPAAAPQLYLMHGAHGLGSGDFAETTQKVPSSYYMLGADSEGEEKRLGQYTPKIEFNEAILSTGAAIYAQTAADWLQENL